MARISGLLCGFLSVDFFFHMIHAFAVGFKADSISERIGAVCFGVLILAGFMVIFQRYFSPSFFNGFVVATGLFLSFDIVVFHWIFQLHRITSGPEANVLEPLLVIAGLIFLFQGISRERRDQKKNSIKVTQSRNT